VEKLAACDHEDDLQPLNPTAAAFQPSAAAAAAANIPPAAEAAFQRLDDRRSEAAMFNEGFTPAEVQQALRKMNNGKAGGLSSEPVDLLRYATLKAPDGKVEFTETHDLRSLFQAGFRPALSCRHLLMMLQHFISKYSTRKGSCSAALWKGAYDCVPRKQVWQALAGLGIHGNMLKGIKAMYNNSQLTCR